VRVERARLRVLGLGLLVLIGKEVEAAGRHPGEQVSAWTTRVTQSVTRRRRERLLVHWDGLAAGLTTSMLLRMRVDSLVKATLLGASQLGRAGRLEGIRGRDGGLPGER
jgi:hypothetical protein